MIKFNELKVGDMVNVEFEGQMRVGEVIDLDREDKLVCVETEVQEFWYEPQHLFPLPITDAQLKSFGFEKIENADGSVKYMKEAFRILLHKNDDFSAFEMWYREDRRHITHPIFFHELQNHYLQMTKVELAQ
ncbi:MAG: hypothetical protein JST58_14680 [Bacteroidetes bacterium]|nr:hypothetical protein [Bacteroidota bacterium]